MNDRRSFGGSAAAVPYLDNLDHLADELARLDLRIKLRVLQQRRPRCVGPLEPLRGLVVEDEEIDAVLAAPRDGPGVANALELDDHEEGAHRDLIEQLGLNIAERQAASAEAGVYLALPALTVQFGLSTFEAQVLVLCLAPELDRAYEKLYAYLHDDVTRKLPSVDLALDVLCQPSERVGARWVFAPEAPLRRFRLLEWGPGSNDGPELLRARSLKLDDRIVGALLGQNALDQRVGRVARLALVNTPDVVTDDPDVVGRTRDIVRRHLGEAGGSDRCLILHFHGPHRQGALALARTLADDAGWRLLVADARALRTVDRGDFTEVAWRLARETLLAPALLCVEACDRLVDGEAEGAEHQLAELLTAVRACCRVIVLGSDRPWPRRDLVIEDAFLEVAFPLPNEPVRERLWRRELDDLQVAHDLDLDLLVSTFRFTGEQIRAAAAEARLRAAWRCPEAPIVTAADLSAACRALSNQRLVGMAQKLESHDRWADLVLPAEPMAQLQQIANHIRHKALVFGDWGFARKLPRGRGLTALFAGPSGTGKTMAAGVIANELALDLYRIDLSQVVSKYIGETEKNLDRVFHEAETSNAILFFDEADALFGKRSDIKDAHDRYANIETSYLLQKMEEYQGLAILATNLRANLDEAFARRMRFAVEFPMPDEERRARIWANVFPRQAPVADDVDPARLARMLKVSGGNIANIALAASFFAAEEQSEITGPLILRAARREFQKIGRVWDDAAGRGH